MIIHARLILNQLSGRKMKEIYMLTLFILSLCLVGPSLADDYTPGNFGVLRDYTKLGHISGNAMNWDYTLIFKLRRNDEYRALADIEESIKNNDTLVGMETYDGIVIASIRTDADQQALFSRYARASKLTSLCQVYSFKWTYSDEWDEIVGFGERRLSSICK